MVRLHKPEVNTDLSRRELWLVLRDNRGSVNEIAQELGVTRHAIFQWLSGMTDSQRVGVAVREYVKNLLASDRENNLGYLLKRAVSKRRRAQ